MSSTATPNQGPGLQIRDNLANDYSDIYTPETLAALAHMSQYNIEQKRLMEERTRRRLARMRDHQPVGFLPADSEIKGTGIRVQDARDGNFVGAVIPHDLQRQWLQGTGPAAKPNSPVKANLRNVAYALLSGADGWMFDGEDALGQITTMSLDNQRSLKLAIARDPQFLEVAEAVAEEMNAWARDFFGREIVSDWRKQLDFTTKIFRARGLHLDDRHIRLNEESFSASITDMTLYVVNNYKVLQAAGSSIVLYLPKIQTAEEAGFWNRLITALESYLGLDEGTIKGYVLVEQLEATFQLMEIRAALGLHFVGFNTGRWDYINSVSDANCWNPDFINPNIESIVMTYGYMRNYEDRVRRAVNTPDANGNFALWQGGMEPNIPVGSKEGVANSMKKAKAGAVREQQEGACGKWIAHWKMAHIIRPVWEEIGEDNQSGRQFPPLTYTDEDAAGLTLLEPAPRTVRGARNLLSVALQYGNAFGQGKDVPRIALAHGIPYVATGTVAEPHDLERKVEAAMAMRGPRYIHVFVPCPLGWGSASADTIKLARLVKETGLFPVFEAVDGEIREVSKIRRRTPVEDYLKLQRRYAHLFGEHGHPEIVERLQAIADRNIHEYGLLDGDGEGEAW